MSIGIFRYFYVYTNISFSFSLYPSTYKTLHIYVYTIYITNLQGAPFRRVWRDVEPQIEGSAGYCVAGLGAGPVGSEVRPSDQMGIEPVFAKQWITVSYIPPSHPGT